MRTPRMPEPGKIVFYVFSTILALIMAFGTWFTTELGYNYIVQNTLTGSTSFYSDAGTHFKMPFFTRIHQYKQAATINFSGNAQTGVEADSGQFTRLEPAISVTFADTYSGDVPVNFRFRLPRDEDSMLKITRNSVPLITLWMPCSPKMRVT